MHKEFHNSCTQHTENAWLRARVQLSPPIDDFYKLRFNFQLFFLLFIKSCADYKNSNKDHSKNEVIEIEI